VRTPPRPRRSLLERAAHGAERLEERSLALGLLVLAVAGVITYLSIIAINGIPFSDPYRVRIETPADAPLLKDGDEIRIGGQRAGQIRRVDLGAGGGALLDVDLDDGPIGRDATATVRLRGLAGATYLELDPATTSDPLPENGLVPRAQTHSGVELTDVVDAFDPGTAGAVRRTLGAYGRGFSGRGGDLNRALGDLGPALDATTPLLRAATTSRGELARLLGGAGRVARAFATPAGTDLEGLLPPAAITLTVTADRAAAIQSAITALPALAASAAATLPDADALLDDASVAVGQLRPAVVSLRDALPDVLRLLRRRADLASLSAIAERARPVLRAATPVLRELTPSAASLAPLAAPLRTLSEHLARYERDLFLAPDGFTRWGGFHYDVGQAPGARAVRFLPVFTCMRARDPYPEPGEALTHSQECAP